ncbi:hypothetical protein A9Q86_01920 [Flavobacteriales bacterium 33_180_T64]|nr:hypothetical protein A9Q86_01920 [Flavobacteriales bacterium 33_180_T64]
MLKMIASLFKSKIYLKRSLSYLIWVVLSLLFGVGYMRLLLGSAIKEPKTALSYLLSMFFYFGIFRVGLIIGGIIALLFILIDAFYLKKKLDNKTNLIRFIVLLIITMFVVVIHYTLEKVIDII